MNETAFVIALVWTLAAAVLVVVILHRPLGRMLADNCARDPQTAFWVRFAEVLLMLIPLTLLAVGGAAENNKSESLVLDVVQYAKWSLIGQVGAVFTLAALLAGVLRPMMSSVWVAPHQINDLERLLAKVDKIRAREVLRSVEEASSLLGKFESGGSTSEIMRRGTDSSNS